MTNQTQTPCYKDAIKLLMKKDYSIYKIKLKLLDKGHLDSEINDIIDILIEKKYLREDFYIDARVRGLIRKNYGPLYIQQKLNQEHCSITIDEIDAIYEEIGVTQIDQIHLLKKKKKISSFSSLNEQLKFKNFLYSKGFNQDLF